MIHSRMLCLGAALALSTAAAADDPREKIAQTIEPIFQNPPKSGLLVFEVLPKLQADRAGFKVGDIITEYDGREVRNTTHLQRIAAAAAKEGRSRLPVVAFRNGQNIEAEFDAAPMGVRIVAVDKGEKRFLWRAPSEYQPDMSPVERAVAGKHRWELLQYGGKYLGWARTYYAVMGDKIVMRTQSQTASEQLKEKRDTLVTFSTKSKTLAPLSIRQTIDGKLTLELFVENGVLKGKRGGIADSAALPQDAVAAELAGLVCTTMPRQKGACLRCSYLETGSLVAAPFGDIFCLGQDDIKISSGSVSCVRYDQAVFGRSVAHYWVDSKGEVIQTRFGNGFFATKATSTEVGLTFPNVANEFPPIENLPNLNPPTGQVAN
jgi:hypothetical protein